jgi:hypothetical protein
MEEEEEEDSNTAVRQQTDERIEGGVVGVFEVACLVSPD